MVKRGKQESPPTDEKRMSHLVSYRRAQPNCQPDYAYSAYRSTVRRAPKLPLIVLPHTLS